MLYKDALQECPYRGAQESGGLTGETSSWRNTVAWMPEKKSLESIVGKTYSMEVHGLKICHMKK